jgi:hypothetical protein
MRDKHIRKIIRLEENENRKDFAKEFNVNNSDMNSFSDFEFELLSFQLRVSAGEYAEQLTDGRQRS